MKVLLHPSQGYRRSKYLHVDVLSDFLFLLKVLLHTSQWYETFPSMYMLMYI